MISLCSRKFMISLLQLMVQWRLLNIDVLVSVCAMLSYEILKRFLISLCLHQREIGRGTCTFYHDFQPRNCLISINTILRYKLPLGRLRLLMDRNFQKVFKHLDCRFFVCQFETSHEIGEAHMFLMWSLGSHPFIWTFGTVISYDIIQGKGKEIQLEIILLLIKFKSRKCRQSNRSITRRHCRRYHAKLSGDHQYHSYPRSVEPEVYQPELRKRSYVRYSVSKRDQVNQLHALVWPGVYSHLNRNEL
ncbi:hypothetical protein BCR41DRAFT_412795 [Lobosporangium transversale]|uniref:Uncharacterized protein n=1 Tax=Lobosporangium transversale TaxID=64571 RepID=A0A1Y2GBZ6_9FUNG|nr:hypothetical protein BCR41DRAFT_412795 [Lobosporangium transversale]ORZ06601.1 hypothetical protein BCR41DRAFT_412795 [Lobosporangium transversale]|eukprot:XP_021877644.1 hypothetical protein BCR41DRAFT_412795 [Lobosporangium transversale]